MRFPEANTHILKGGFPLSSRIAERVVGKLFAGKRFPEWLRGNFDKELNSLRRVLEKEKVRILNPHPVLPLAEEPLGLSQVFPRDTIVVLGTRIVVGRPKLPVAKKEIRGILPLLRQEVDLGETHPLLVPPENTGLHIEGGDVLVDNNRLYVGIGNHATNAKAVDWLRSCVGDRFEVIPVRITGEGIFHLDTALTLIGPRTGIVCRTVLQNPLPWPLRDYDLIEVDEKIRMQVGTNVFMVGPKKIVVQSRHRGLRNELESRGYKVYAIDFTWHARAGGSFRCATHPLRRE